MKVLCSNYLCSILAILVIGLPVYMPLANAAEALALPSGDLVAPIITHTPVSGEVDNTEYIEISAEVTDNVGVQDVIIYYRAINETNFMRTNMIRERETDKYVVKLKDIPPPGVEYYIKASDLAGNILLHGHSFSPLTIAVASTEPGIAKPIAKVPSDEPGKGVNKWVWVGLGVLAVGAVMANSDDGGGGNGGAASTKPKDSVVNINAPIP